MQTTQLTESVPTLAVSAPPLVCPLDRLHLEIVPGSAELSCAAGHSYPVRRGIPRFVGSQPGYADAFGEQWHHYRTTQLDSYTNTSISHDRLRRCLGEELWAHFQQRSPLQVLEAGCGAGRFTEILLQLPAAVVTSTDLSSAVEPNQLNCPQSAHHRVVQCDINNLPFLPGQYDVVICLGVIQHTRDPEESIEDLYRQLKPGGWLVIDHYRPSLSLYTRFGEMLLRPVLKRLPPQQGLAVTKALTRALFPLHRATRRLRPLQMILSRLSPLLTYYHSFPQLSDQLQYEWAELDTHDSLTDYYKHVRTTGSIARQLRALNGRHVWVDKNGNGVEARCQKPS